MMCVVDTLSTSNWAAATYFRFCSSGLISALRSEFESYRVESKLAECLLFSQFARKSFERIVARTPVQAENKFDKGVVRQRLYSLYPQAWPQDS